MVVGVLLPKQRLLTSNNSSLFYEIFVFFKKNNKYFWILVVFAFESELTTRFFAPFYRCRYSFLKNLGLSENNAGVFDGTWSGSGEVFESINPVRDCFFHHGQLAKFLFFAAAQTTGEVVGTVRGATMEEYNRTVDKAMEAQKKWRSVSFETCCFSFFSFFGFVISFHLDANATTRRDCSTNRQCFEREA